MPPALSRAAMLQTAYEFQGIDHVAASSVQSEGGSIERPELGLLKEAKKLVVKLVHPLKGMAY